MIDGWSWLAQRLRAGQLCCVKPKKHASGRLEDCSEVISIDRMHESPSPNLHLARDEFSDVG